MRWISVLAGLCLAAPAPSPPEEVARAISDRRGRVQELQVIRAAAEELGLRVWLFGGTAAGFAHYVRWDLAREAGDRRYRGSFFDYDFTNIYRSTQDADLVVDGTPQQAERLESLIREKMSFLQGSKDHWEVRLLRQDRTAPGGQVKQALLHNPDFLGQNTDSNSTGMIELTDPPQGESVIRDLRDWDSPHPFFLRDVALGRLHYYRSPTHGETSRFKSGDNPPLFSVIRYLVKAFQYDLRVDGEDLQQVQSIIDAFDPGRDYPALSPWAKGWLERYGPNLIRHSVNIEYAWETLERMGLRHKLVGLSNPSQEGTLGWWLSREPLRTRAVGEGTGKTAAELGMGVVAHETRDFLAYESITRDTTLRPNVLISRPNHPGETAAHGPGFYTRLGKTGAIGTGLTIRFRVDPRSREGTDFTVHGDFVLFRNRAALQVIPESLDGSLLQYFEMLRDGLADPGDRGAWMKLRRRLSLRPVTEDEERRIAVIVSEGIDRLAREGRGFLRAPGEPSPMLAEWFSLPASRTHPEPLEKLRAAASALVDGCCSKETFPAQARGELLALTLEWLTLPDSLAHPELIERMIQHGSLDVFVATHVLTRPGWSAHPELFRALARKGTVDDQLAELLERPEWAGQSDLMRSLIENSPPLAMRRPAIHSGMPSQIAFALSHAHWLDPELALLFMDRIPEMATWLLWYSSWAKYPELLFAAVARKEDFADGHYSFDEMLRFGPWRDHPGLRALCGEKAPTMECLEGILREHSIAEAARLAGGSTDLPALANWTGKRESSAAEELSLPGSGADRLRAAASALVDRCCSEDALPSQVKGELLALTLEWFALPESLAHPELVERMIQQGSFDVFVATQVLTRPGWSAHPELFQALARKGTVDDQLAEVLQGREWAVHPALMRSLIENSPPLAMRRPAIHSGMPSQIAFALSHEHWLDPELALLFMERAPDMAGRLLWYSSWGKYPELLFHMIAGKETYQYGSYDFSHVLRHGPWPEHPGVRKLCGGNALTVPCLEQVLQQHSVAEAGRLANELRSLSPPSTAEECR